MKFKKLIWGDGARYGVYKGYVIMEKGKLEMAEIEWKPRQNDLCCYYGRTIFPYDSWSKLSKNLDEAKEIMQLNFEIYMKCFWERSK